MLFTGRDGGVEGAHCVCVVRLLDRRIDSTLLPLSRFGSRLFHSLAPDADIAEQDKSLGFVFHDI